MGGVCTGSSVHSVVPSGPLAVRPPAVPEYYQNTQTKAGLYNRKILIYVDPVAMVIVCQLFPGKYVLYPA